MLDCHSWDELTEQCFRRVKNYKRQHDLRWSEPRQVQLTHTITSIVWYIREEKPLRIPGTEDISPCTGVPDTYIDDVIKYYRAESQRIAKLSAGDSASWQELYPIIRGYTFRHLLSSRSLTYYQMSLETLAHDVISKTYVKLANSQFRSFCYDCPLDTWIGRYAIHTTQELLRDYFRYADFHFSLEESLPGTNGLAKSDIIPDDRAQSEMESRQKRLAVEQEIRACLPPSQAEVITRTLAGESTAEIARAMRRTHNAIYILRARAVKTLRSQFGD